MVVLTTTSLKSHKINNSIQVTRYKLFHMFNIRTTILSDSMGKWGGFKVIYLYETKLCISLGP